MTGTDEYEAIRGNGGIPNSVKTAVDAIHNRQGSELQTQQNQVVAPKQMQLNGVEPGSVAKAVRNIENSQASKGRPAGLDERNDRGRALVRG
ncbi:hypothetical protein ASD00_32620 [Ensifer sp. Root31]|nr:hypothetical protein ASD00_32620 [Ensifer sp. Root31]